MFLLIIRCLLLVEPHEAFAPPRFYVSTRRHPTTTAVGMVPRFDPTSERWIPASDDESESAGYPPIRSLLRHGPKAFLARVTSPDQYDQAVLKFMAAEKCSRWEAMGNMDRYFENAQDWIFERLEAERKGYKLDYVTLDQKQTILSLLWVGVTIWFGFEFVKTIQEKYM